MADDCGTIIANFLPCEGIEGTTTDLLGRWLNFLERLFAGLDELPTRRCLSGWASTLTRLLDELFTADPSEEAAANAIRQILDELRQQEAASAFSEPIGLPVI